MKRFEVKVVPSSLEVDTFLSSLPSGPGLERWARTTGALDRKRGVQEAAALLRIALTYSFCGLSLKATSLWAKACQLAEVSKQAILRRIRRCGPWLEEMVASKLAQNRERSLVRGYQIRLVDATRVCTPGSTGQCWRIHAAYDPWSGRLLEVEVTDHRGGERLNRFSVRPGDLLIGDRVYAHRPGLAHVVAGGGDFVVRMSWHNLPLEAPDGRAFDLFSALRGLRSDEVGEFDVCLAPDDHRSLHATPCRLIAVRKPLEATQEAQKRLKAEAKRKKRKLDPRTLEACGYFLVVTSLPRPAFSARQVLDLYRLRWQIEIEFKRLKSLLNLDQLRAQAPDLVRATLAGKLLGALLVEELVASCGGDPSTVWTLTQLWGEAARQLILGRDMTEKLLAQARQLPQWAADGARARQLQCTSTRQLLA